MNVSFGKRALPASGVLVVLVSDAKKLSPSAIEVDEALGGQLKRAMKVAGFSGKPGDSVQILAPEGLKATRLIALGLGNVDKIDADGAQTIGAQIVQRLKSSGETAINIMLDPLTGKKAMDEAEFAAQLGLGAQLAIYSFDKYQSKKQDKEKSKKKLSKLVFLTAAATAARKRYGALEAVGEGVAFARDLIIEPPNVLTPAEFAKRCKALSKLGCDVTVLSEAQMSKLGMRALLGVGQGSENSSHLAIMRWNGGPKSQKPIALVGKGVCFDSGGISLKPGGGMEDMKGDMGGAAAVAGAMHAIAGRKAKANVVGLVGLVENMPDGKAQRPSDIVTSMSGQTIEIINTDAEGRLVLADVLWYCQDKIKPQLMIDLATLTGAMMVALGDQYAGFFSNNDELSNKLMAAGTASGDHVWRLPLGEGYDKKINSRFADMKNIGGRGAGATTAAQFLQRFVNDTPWAHIDIAGVAWGLGGPKQPAWGSGFGVRLLDQLVADFYEK